MSCVRAELVTVIKVSYDTGSGGVTDPFRECVKYFLPDGTEIGEYDPIQIKSNSKADNPHQHTL